MNLTAEIERKLVRFNDVKMELEMRATDSETKLHFAEKKLASTECELNRANKKIQNLEVQLAVLKTAEKVCSLSYS